MLEYTNHYKVGYIVPFNTACLSNSIKLQSAFCFNVTGMMFSVLYPLKHKICGISWLDMCVMRCI